MESGGCRRIGLASLSSRAVTYPLCFIPHYRRSALRCSVMSMAVILFMFHGMTALATQPAESNTSLATFPQQAYVWQRAWNEPLLEALRQHAKEFSGLAVLTAEVTWNGNRPSVVHVTPNYRVLIETGRPVSLVLRIGPYTGPFATNDSTAIFLVKLARSLIQDAKTQGLDPSEVQLDFDCAESKLAGYRAWIEVIRPAVAPVPLVPTTLPSWLKQSAFKELASAAGSFVLQVHSLERPQSPDAAFTLCNPAAAQSAVRAAASLEIPFRVALPTYGYLVAFDKQGKFIGLSAEGPPKNWPPGAQTREIRSNPLEIAGLLLGWATNRPPSLKGALWYRFPVSQDRINWRWPTLGAIVALRSPRESFRAESRRVEPGLVEISLVNDGELDISSRLAVKARWQNARLVAADGLRGFVCADDGPSAMRFENPSQFRRLEAGERRVVGWLRFKEDREVRLEVQHE